MEHTLKPDEIRKEILKIIMENPGINDYGILSKLAKNINYSYDNGFHHYLFEVQRDNDMRVSSDGHYYARKVLKVNMYVEAALPIKNCFHCECLKDVKNSCSSNIDKNPQDGNEYICALNPAVRFKPDIWNAPADCPVNKAYKEMNP